MDRKTYNRAREREEFYRQLELFDSEVRQVSCMPSTNLPCSADTSHSFADDLKRIPQDEELQEFMRLRRQEG